MVYSTTSEGRRYVYGLDYTPSNTLHTAAVRHVGYASRIPVNHLQYVGCCHETIAPFSPVYYVTGKETVEHSLNNGAYTYTEDRVYYS